MTGLFISFEGGEGSGKTTQVVRLAERLRQTGVEVITTREPGGTPGAEAIRTLLVTGEVDRWDALSELFLLNAARRDHVQRVIEPALENGVTVLCDRFIDSTRIYQGAVKGLADELICEMHDRATGSLWPDRTFLFDLPAHIGLQRAAARHEKENRYEGEGLDFHSRLRDGFRALAQLEPERIFTIDASQSVDVVTAQLWRQIAP